MGDMGIRGVIQNKGLTDIDKIAKDIEKDLKDVDASDQVALIKLQQKMATYNNNLSLMSTMLKTLADTDKEIIRNV